MPLWVPPSIKIVNKITLECQISLRPIKIWSRRTPSRATGYRRYILNYDIIMTELTQLKLTRLSRNTY